MLYEGKEKRGALFFSVPYLSPASLLLPLHRLLILDSPAPLLPLSSYVCTYEV